MITPADSHYNRTPQAPDDVDPSLAALVGGVCRAGGWTISERDGRWELSPPGLSATAAASLGATGGLDWSRSTLGAFCESVTGLATIHAEPSDQVRSVRQLSARLLSHYSVDAGHIYLGGCSLDPQPLLRLSWTDGRRGVQHEWLDRDGQPADAGLVESLGVERLTVLPRPPRRWDERAADRVCQSRPAPDPVVTVVWVTMATGQVIASVGEHAVGIPFSGWAHRFAAGVETPPPYRCPETGAESYHLAMTDDGEVTCAEAIGECDVSGGRQLRSQLVTCDATEQLVSVNSTLICALSGKHVLRDAALNCAVCDQLVSPRVVAGGRCELCQSMQFVATDDERLKRLLASRIELSTWKKWQAAVSDQIAVYSAVKWTRRVVLVVDCATEQVVRRASGSRWGNSFRDDG